jgi:hypothetical protein
MTCLWLHGDFDCRKASQRAAQMIGNVRWAPPHAWRPPQRAEILECPMYLRLRKFFRAAASEATDQKQPLAQRI